MTNENYQENPIRISLQHVVELELLLLLIRPQPATQSFAYVRLELK